MDNKRAFADFHEMEEGMDTGKAMIAGAAAGVMEHICMFPVDTIKTRLQAIRKPGGPRYGSVVDAFVQIKRTEGFLRLYRGITAVVMGAIPSHAVYFGTYELFKRKLGANIEGYHPLTSGIAGGVATMAHDAVVTPLDVIKQRLQIHNSEYTGVMQCVRTVIKEEGLKALYASYPTTVVMNVPFMSVHFATYESLKHLLALKGEHGTRSHIIAGCGAGALGGLVSNPLDVIKTRIQLHDRIKNGPVSVRRMVKSMIKEEGSKTFFKGTTARVLYFMPSAAICWTTYETAKSLLGVTPSSRID